MKLITTHPYIKVTRKIDWNVQKYDEEIRTIELYDETIIWMEEKVSIEDVFDVSYKISKASMGVLYLHTNRGVFPFYVKQAPDDFIEHYKLLKKK
ncbi:hypothetical protein [Cytobacillus purgationiresistens]|uniref:YcxB-like protein domain-containing protein n=1 Tax=Cytobacillus purgationiresistens TaxID=863449 RepID=A0ABU0AJT2_9BACI|nr:hypothetical protein [Cytobacillus purgationiresistens]MDQ0271525.1 hypothetical protein [Cytobacillus purgationiresistens]